MEWLTINALKSAFAPFDERLRLINEVVKPGYAHLRAATVAVSTVPTVPAAVRPSPGAVPPSRRPGAGRPPGGARHQATGSATTKREPP